MIAAIICAWLAGIAFGWQFGMRQRHVNEEQAFWAYLAGRRTDQYDWAAELDLWPAELDQ